MILLHCHFALSFCLAAAAAQALQFAILALQTGHWFSAAAYMLQLKLGCLQTHTSFHLAEEFCCTGSHLHTHGRGDEEHRFQVQRLLQQHSQGSHSRILHAGWSSSCQALSSMCSVFHGLQPGFLRPLCHSKSYLLVGDVLV